MDIGQTSIERNGVRYGADDDARGPIGGGAGYVDVVTTGDVTVHSIDELLAALTDAKAVQTIFIPGDVELDMTARIYIEEAFIALPEGVTLASDRGHNGSPGAHILSLALQTKGIIRPTGPGARVTGIRLQGPNPNRHLDHHHRSFAEGRGHEYYYKLPTSDGIISDQDRTRVDNCEISGFSLGGVNLKHGVDNHVHHCHIHHCQYQGLGYGVCIDIATVTIERNLFNYNRHSIAGTGRENSGYIARHNVELGESLSHCFDMHGGRDREDGTDVAGSKIEIHHNTFRVPNKTPIVIRGTPTEPAEVHHNWFPMHDSKETAVRCETNVNITDNVYGNDAAGR